RRLGAAVHDAVGDGVSARDRRLELSDSAETGRALPPRIRLLPRRPRASGASLRNDSVSRRLRDIVVDAQNVSSGWAADVLVPGAGGRRALSRRVRANQSAGLRW